jgi:hypothetical protein
VAEASVKSAVPDDEPGGIQVAVPRNALKKWAKVREFTLGPPGCCATGWRRSWTRPVTVDGG